MFILCVLFYLFLSYRNRKQTDTFVHKENALASITKYQNYTDKNFMSISVKYKGKMVHIGNKRFKSIITDSFSISESGVYTGTSRISMSNARGYKGIQIVTNIPQMPDLQAGSIANMNLSDLSLGVWYKASIPNSSDTFEVMITTGSIPM